MIICLTLLCGYAKAQTRGGDSSPPLPKEVSAELFDKAVGLIKEFEGWHDHTKHPYIGYGHKLLPHENLTADITEAQADSLLRADLLERYKYFRQYGKDALLLSEISDNKIEYLRDSYFRYAELMNVKAEHTPGRTIGEGIVNLYNEMNDLVNKSGMYLNLEDDNGCLYFNVWNTHTWGEYTLYYFPVKFVEELNPTLRRIVITFYHNFMKENGITTINDEADMDWAIDMLTEGCYEDEDAKERRAREKLVKSYKDGRAYKLLDRVWRKSYYKNLPKAIEEYECKNGFEQGLIELLRRGLEFIKTDKAIMYYGYDPFYDEEPDYLPMTLEQQIRVVYDSDDIMTEHLIDFYNSSRQESYDIIPASTFAVSPTTDKVFTLEDTYPERFFKWADDFIHYIR